jgi:hypothetical protein
MNSCPKFKQSVNMSARAIKAWAKDPRAKEARFEATRRRLPALAALKAKPCGKWTKQDERFARRVLSFNARMSGVVRQYGCTRKALIALRNWGRQITSCPIPERK